jgi:hypothetical protein
MEDRKMRSNSQKRKSLHWVTIVLVSILLIQGSPLCFAQNIVWTVTDNLSGYADEAFAVTCDGTYIYVAGYDCSEGSSNHRWRIQKRNKSDGSVVWDVNENPSSSDDVVKAIACDGSYIYMAGYDYSPGHPQGRIQKRNKSDGSVVWTVTEHPSDSVAAAITSDGAYIYLAGYGIGPGNNQWRIQKRNKSDGSVVWTLTEDPSTLADSARAITCDVSYIYVAGYDSSQGFGNSQWRIQKRNKSDGSVVWTKTDNPSSSAEIAYAITSDDTYIYVAGLDSSPGDAQWRIQKRNKSDGSLVWAETDNPSSSWDEPYAITCDGTYICVAGYDSSPGDRQWRIQKRNKSDGSLVWTETENPSSSIEDRVLGMASDGTYIYVAGCDSSQGDMQWRIQKRETQALIDALIDIDPDTLNKKSHGQWVTVYITLPDGYDVGTIDISTVGITSLTGASCPPSYTQSLDLSFTPQVGDRDEDGIPDLTAKFDRQMLLPNLCLDDVGITVEGDLTTGRHFSGSDTIRIIDRGK